MSLQSKQVRRMFARGFAVGTTGIGFLLVTAALTWGAEIEGPTAEGFKTLEPHKTLTTDGTKRRQTEDLIRRIINGGPLNGSEVVFDAYFNSYLFPLFTLTTEKNLNELPKERDRFIKGSLELSGAKNPAAHSRLVDLTYTKLSEIAQDPEFHPAVRYNAIMIVGLLNETEPNRGSGVSQLPEPYIKALSTLMEELKKPGNNEAVRVGALLGVTRHLEWDNAKATGSGKKIPPAMRNDAITELTSIVNTKVPPAGRSAEGQTWLRRRALEALGHANAAKVEPEFAKLLSDIIASDAEPISLRCTAADVMAHVLYPASAPPPIQPMAKDLGYLALFACNSELLRLEGLKKYDERLIKISGGAMGGGGMPGMGGGMPGMGGGMPGMGGATPGMGGATPGMGGGAGKPGGAGGGAGGMPLMPGMPGMGGDGGRKGSRGSGDKGSKIVVSDPKHYRIEYSKRRLRAELNAVQLALGRKKSPTGLLAYSKAAADTTALETITKQIEDIVRIVEEQDQGAEDYDKDLRKEMRKLEGLTGKKLPIAAVPGTPKADATKGPAAPGAVVPMDTKPGAEEPVEEIPAAPAAKGGPAAPPAGAKDAAPPAAADEPPPAAKK